MDEKDEFRRYASRYKTEKIKSRNLSEKKRRDQFNMLINELCSMVTSNSRKMDKSSVLRSTISFLKNHSELSVQSQNVEVQENWKPSFLSNEEFTHLMLEALDGFIIVFSCNGQILYTSESTASLLGYLPSRIYSSVFDIIHEVDKSSLYKLISSAPNSSNNSLSRDSFISLLLHMKRGPIHSQSNSISYELVNLVGTFYHWPSTFEGSNPSGFDCDSNSCSSICSPLPSTTVEWRSCFVAVGRLQTPHLLKVVNLSEESKNEFSSRHSLEWKFLFLDHRAPPIIGYLPFEVLGTSGYDYYHVDDLDNIAASHELLMQTGEGTSCFYRFLTKGQQWIWLQTRYYISYHQWNSKPEFIVCTHTVVSTEKVLKGNQDAPKRLSRRFSSSNLSQTNTPPSQSACLSPSPSVSSLGSFSSEHSEQCSGKASSSNVLINSVLYAAHGGKEIPSPKTRAPSLSNPTISEGYLDMQPSLSTIQPASMTANDMGAISSTAPAVMPAPGPPENHVSTASALSVPPTVTAVNNTSSAQFQGERTSAVCQAQMQEYLRRRHQMLQQQIMLQQEELRRVSEQLMLVQFAVPGPTNTSDIPYQASSSSMGSNLVNTYSSTRPLPHLQIPDATSTANVIMKSVDGYTRPTQSSITSRPYLNLEAELCGVGTSGGISLLTSNSMEQNNEVIAQGFPMTHSMQSNT
ncbi:neuronal PAS domain-containing protein 2-like [Stegodyphus dumicola]|uniref:neuronal PAS domain-containing protein 2-like n=1 Tax=Stegodyphus dumicola TaxID=202533 RepID=UPI0015AC66FC|nr:neuronal PAS domain-containing protein 2-like [Stegodyphus dumicola]